MGGLSSYGFDWVYYTVAGCFGDKFFYFTYEKAFFGGVNG